MNKPSPMQSTLQVPARDEVHLWTLWADRRAGSAVMGKYLNVEATEVRLEVGRYGKPFLAAEDGGADLRFNVSHAGELSVVAVAAGRDVGVDVESLDDPPAALEGVLFYFHSRERAAIDAVPASYRRESLLRYWTCKEAYLKGIGRGLTTPLNHFAVQWERNSSPILLEIDSGHSSGWTLGELPLPRGYIGALAVEGACRLVQCGCV